MKDELVVGTIYAIRRGPMNYVKAQFNGTVLRGSKIKRTHYIFKNMGTGRIIELKSKQKIRNLNDAGTRVKQGRDWSKVADERCRCGELKSNHEGVLHHLGCAPTNCERYTWKEFVDSEGNKV